MSANSIAEKFEVIADSVYKNGIIDERKRFGINYQHNGNRFNYSYAYAGSGWTEETFFPELDIVVTESAIYMFYQNQIEGLDLRPKQFKEKYGVNIDLSRATNRTQMIAWSNVVALGTIDAMSTTNGLYYSCYGASKLKIIEKIIMPAEDDTTINVGYAFDSCIALEEVYFDGVIAVSINFQWCPLIKASLENIGEHLSTTATGKTVIFKKSAVNAAFGVNVDDVSTYTDEFNEWRNSRKNWTFNYV